MYNSSEINPDTVRRFKTALKPTIAFPMSTLEKLALASALEELAAELRQEARPSHES